MKYIIIFAVLILFLASACGNVVDADVNGEDEKPACVDSDGGVKASEPGETKGYLANGKYVEAKDSCLPPFLVEYYCEDGIVKNKNIRCQICTQGACPIVIKV